MLNHKVSLQINDNTDYVESAMCAIRSNERTRFVPGVAKTTWREEQDVLRSYQLPANSYVVKPVDLAQSAEAVRHLDMYIDDGPPSKLVPGV